LPWRRREPVEPRALLLKYAKDEDFYVAWSESCEEPAWYGTRAEAAKFGYTEERIARADENGTSSMPLLADGSPWKGGPFYAWDDDGMIVLQRGFLRRETLRAFTILYLGGEQTAAFDLLEPFEESAPGGRPINAR
jgi:hypothetical protein